VRDEIRGKIDSLFEMCVECPIETLAERDPKGLQHKAPAGEIKNFTGMDNPYEALLQPDLVYATPTSARHPPRGRAHHRPIGPVGAAIPDFH
jgi:adenylylsulfate kinase-like enzyme